MTDPAYERPPRLMPLVLNIKHLPGFRELRPIIPPGAVYIGRRMSKYGLEQSVWANPYVEGKDGTRDEVIALFRERVLPGLLPRIHELRGRSLVCWCKPLPGRPDVPCHGDVLLELANA
jgi:Domain of unknown function (DUF4326)